MIFEAPFIIIPPFVLIANSSSGLSKLTATLTLSNFEFEPIVESSNVCFQFDSNLGSVTVDSVNVTNENNTFTIKSEGVNLVATPNNGNGFAGWVDVTDNSIISLEKSYNLKPRPVEKTVPLEFAQGKLINGEKQIYDIGRETAGYLYVKIKHLRGNYDAQRYFTRTS